VVRWADGKSIGGPAGLICVVSCAIAGGLVLGWAFLVSGATGQMSSWFVVAGKQLHSS